MQVIKEKKIGEYLSQMVFTPKNQLSLLWYSPQGTLLKTQPSAVKKAFPDDLIKWKDKVKKDRRYLSNRRKEIDRYYIKKQLWTYPEFDKKLLSHPLTSCLTRKLIWQIRGEGGRVNVFRVEDRWIDINGQPVSWINNKSEVRLWHPVYSDKTEVVTWRGFMEKHEIIQPIKQAFREVYILTDAERRTHIYSNRMAAHILKQKQFQALTRARGWKSSTMAYDVEFGAATLDLKIWGLKAAYWISRADDDEEQGFARYIATDQIRFDKNSNPVALELIPAVVFSEVLRDADLFVGVASVGNDPTWQDTGPEGHRDYWTEYSFGELSENAETRKAALEKIIPKLKIANQCQLEGRFLRVDGGLRTYKIHLGSGNILMEPNDQYLCIVPDNNQKSDNHLFLPFEGDRTLSVILSKAFMLADDVSIEDKTILSQIG
ncbi:MAG: DUF4132 domain-containing protein [Bacteroidota bacterium]